MPRFIERVIDEGDLDLRSDRLGELESFLEREIDDALSSRAWQERSWMDDLRRYDAVPRNPTSHYPVEGRIPIEVPLGAIAVDAIYSQELSLVFGTSPIITVRATNERYVEHAKAIQRLANFVANQPDFGLKEATEETLLDKNKLGTGIYYIPWVEKIKRAATRQVVTRGPKIRSVAPEDFLVPGGSYHGLEEARWIAMRSWLTMSDLQDMAESASWNIDHTQVASNVDQVRQQRERLGSTHGQISRQGDIYEIWQVWLDFDIDGDGLAEDLLVVYDRTAQEILKIGFNPFDRRPFEVTRYLRQGKLFYGKGLMSVTKSNQDIATDVMNYWLDNAFLANVRMWIQSPDVGLGGTLHAWPGRVFTSNNPEGLSPLQLADVYPSMPQLFQVNLLLTERRTGINELTQNPLQALGNRTPGITAISALQSQNQRFTATFDSGRVATAGGVKQCLFRMQERILAGDVELEDYVIDVLGDDEGFLALEVLRREDFDDAIAVEVTASSASINREADRQNALLLANLLGTYYTRTLELVNLAASPQVPPPVKAVATKISEAAGELIERTIRTFDQVRDPEAFILDIRSELASIQQETPPSVIAQLFGQLAGAGGASEAPASDVVPFAGAV